MTSALKRRYATELDEGNRLTLRVAEIACALDCVRRPFQEHTSQKDLGHPSTAFRNELSTSPLTASITSAQLHISTHPQPCSASQFPFSRTTVLDNRPATLGLEIIRPFLSSNHAVAVTYCHHDRQSKFMAVSLCNATCPLRVTFALAKASGRGRTVERGSAAALGDCIELLIKLWARFCALPS